MALALVYIKRNLRDQHPVRNLTVEDAVRTVTGLDFNDVSRDVAPEVLADVIELFESVQSSQSTDSLGDTLEIVLSSLNAAGRYGQFRTPSHVAQFMARTTPIRKGDVLLDPAAGTGGFLVAALQQRERVSFEILGDEVDQTMVNVARANVLLMGRDHVCIRHRDALNFLNEEADVILANPPFAGRIVNRQSYGLKSNSNKSEILFVELIMRRLREGGVTSIVIPSGVLTSTDSASMAIRRRLIEEGQVLCVIELPRGVFRPYTDILTAIVYWKKSAQTKGVQMFRPISDGFTLDDRREPTQDNQLLEIEADVKEAVRTSKKSKHSMEIGLETLQENSLNLLPSWYQVLEVTSPEGPSLTSLADEISVQSRRLESLIKSLSKGLRNE